MHVCACVYIYGRRFVIVIFMFSCIDLGKCVAFFVRARWRAAWDGASECGTVTSAASSTRPTNAHPCSKTLVHARIECASLCVMLMIIIVFVSKTSRADAKISPEASDSSSG